MPGLALVAVDIEPSIVEAPGLFGGFEVDNIQVAALVVDREGAVIAHAANQPAAVGAYPWLEDAQVSVLR